MPIYEYQCNACQEICEKIMKFSDPNPQTCETCGEGPMTKLMSPSSFHLKGGGWKLQNVDVACLELTDTCQKGVTNVDR